MGYLRKLLAKCDHSGCIGSVAVHYDEQKMISHNVYTQRGSDWVYPDGMFVLEGTSETGWRFGERVLCPVHAAQRKAG